MSTAILPAPQQQTFILTQPTATATKQTKDDEKKLLNKSLLLAYYASPVIISSSQALGLFISLSGIQYKFFDYLENTGPKEQTVINNIITACQSVCESDKTPTPVFDQKAGSIIFNSIVLNTLIAGVFILTVLFSFILHIVVRTAIRQHYKEVEEEEKEEEIKITIKPVLYTILTLLFILLILNIVLTSLLINIENFDRIKGGIFASISVGFLLLVFVSGVSFSI